MYISNPLILSSIFLSSRLVKSNDNWYLLFIYKSFWGALSSLGYMFILRSLMVSLDAILFKIHIKELY